MVRVRMRSWERVRVRVRAGHGMRRHGIMMTPKVDADIDRYAGRINERTRRGRDDDGAFHNYRTFDYDRFFHDDGTFDNDRAFHNDGTFDDDFTRGNIGDGRRDVDDQRGVRMMMEMTRGSDDASAGDENMCGLGLWSEGKRAYESAKRA